MPSVRHSRLSLFAVVMLFIVGVLTTLFVDSIVGGLIIGLSVFLYLLLVWLTAHFTRIIESAT